MGLKIRLARGGSKKRPHYRIVVADERAPRDGKYIEKVGFYNPMVSKDNASRLSVVEERAKYWLQQGAVPTDRVERFLAEKGLVEARSIPVQTKKSLQSEKTKAKVKEREEKRLAMKETLKAGDSSPEGASDVAQDNVESTHEEAKSPVEQQSAVETETTSTNKTAE